MLMLNTFSHKQEKKKKRKKPIGNGEKVIHNEMEHYQYLDTFKFLYLSLQFHSIHGHHFLLQDDPKGQYQVMAASCFFVALYCLSNPCQMPWRVRAGPKSIWPLMFQINILADWIWIEIIINVLSVYASNGTHGQNWLCFQRCINVLPRTCLKT